MSCIYHIRTESPAQEKNTFLPFPLRKRQKGAAGNSVMLSCCLLFPDPGSPLFHSPEENVSQYRSQSIADKIVDIDHSQRVADDDQLHQLRQFDQDSRQKKQQNFSDFPLRFSSRLSAQHRRQKSRRYRQNHIIHAGPAQNVPERNEIYAALHVSAQRFFHPGGPYDRKLCDPDEKIQIYSEYYAGDDIDRQLRLSAADSVYQKKCRKDDDVRYQNLSFEKICHETRFLSILMSFCTS